jgi:hypothetical protein
VVPGSSCAVLPAARAWHRSPRSFPTFGNERALPERSRSCPQSASCSSFSRSVPVLGEAGSSATSQLTSRDVEGTALLRGSSTIAIERSWIDCSMDARERTSTIRLFIGKNTAGSNLCIPGLPGPTRNPQRPFQFVSTMRLGKERAPTDASVRSPRSPSMVGQTFHGGWKCHGLHNGVHRDEPMRMSRELRWIPLRLPRADRLRLDRYSGRTESAGTAP